MAAILVYCHNNLLRSFLQVKNKHLKLLRHPLVGSLIDHKWNKFGFYIYYLNLISYIVFLTFLTTFALIIENPRSQPCLNATVNGSDASNCGE